MKGFGTVWKDHLKIYIGMQIWHTFSMKYLHLSVLTACQWSSHSMPMLAWMPYVANHRSRALRNLSAVLHFSLRRYLPCLLSCFLMGTIGCPHNVSDFRFYYPCGHICFPHCRHKLICAHTQTKLSFWFMFIQYYIQVLTKKLNKNLSYKQIF